MYAVGRLGSYITRGVYTVAGPFHPFGGAVDIVVVQQQDGSFKSSPWYVRFGKFQGVLKAKEKIVDVSVNGAEADFHMFLDQRGEAYFLREVDSEEVDTILSPSSSGEELDGKCPSPNRRPIKSKSLNYDFHQCDSITHIDLSNGKFLGRTNSRRSRILRFVLGRKSIKEGSFRKEEDGSDVVRADLLERAEIAADLLEMKWSTNLASNRNRNDNVANDSSPYGNNELNPEISRKIDEIGVANADHDDTAEEVFVAMPSEKLREENAYNEDNSGLLESCVSNEESSRIGLDGSNEQANETLHLSIGKGGEVSMLAETLHKATEVISEVNSQPETGLLSAEVPLNTHRGLGDEYLESKKISSNTNTIVAQSYAEVVSINPVNVSAEVGSCSIFTICSSSNSVCQVEDTKNTKEVDEMNENRLPFEPVGELQKVSGNFVPTMENPERLEEEQFIFSDLDDIKLSERDLQSSLTSEAIEGGSESSSSNESDSSPGKLVRESLTIDIEGLRGNSKCLPSPVDIPRNCQVITCQEVGRVAKSLPYMWSQFDEFDANHLRSSSVHSLDSKSNSSKWKLLRKDASRIIKSDVEKENQLSDAQPSMADSHMSKELEDVSGSLAVGDPPNIADISSGSWRMWPFRRSRSRKISQPEQNCKIGSDADGVLENPNGDGEKEATSLKANKIKIRELTPTSEQLASLNLKEGKNTVTFTFSTAMLGPQQVDARIFLWRWDTRIVISDVDGTITKSDVLGQFMPLVGRDWSQTGVAHLFSAIKENGYQLLFLSARAISQAYVTRQFLFNLKQDGKALPDGPVVISPDGLFPSLFREVIRRAPHEFKIACLEDIRALFPSDRNPFYAGFGNRDTDEFSYLKVGIPKGKIFIINPKGEVVVNRRVDSKSYISLHALVNGMFPPMSSHEEEDYNSWNFWKLPPPTIDI